MGRTGWVGPTGRIWFGSSRPPITRTCSGSMSTWSISASTPRPSPSPPRTWPSSAGCPGGGRPGYPDGSSCGTSSSNGASRPRSVCFQQKRPKAPGTRSRPYGRWWSVWVPESAWSRPSGCCRGPGSWPERPGWRRSSGPSGRAQVFSEPQLKAD